MKCRSKYCDNQAKISSDVCDVHESRTTFTYDYNLWDEDIWENRMNLLQTMWENDEDKSVKLYLIRNIVIHAHDVAEQSD